MEFSFDRSKEAEYLRNSAQASGQKEAPVKPPFQPTQAASASVDTSTITNERLRKAIEKNRARQAERSRTQPAESHSANEQQAQQNLFGQSQRPSPASRSKAEERVHQSAPKTTTIVTRRSAARAEEADFTPVKRSSRKVASQLSYATTGRKKSKPLDPTLVGYLVKGCWIFCAVMIIRLIFAQGGVVDFYSQKSLHNERLVELSSIKKENMQIVQEIERIQSDAVFQKKLVRDNLGFIAADEFLVLFPK